MTSPESADRAALRVRLAALVQQWRERANTMRVEARDTVVESLIAQRADAFQDCADDLEEALAAVRAPAPPPDSR